MNITQEELNFIFQLGRESGMSKTKEYESWMFENLRYENKSLMEFMSWLKTTHPEAFTEWNAIEKIKES